MSGLLSANQMTALSKLVKKGMTTPLLIYDHVLTESPSGTSESWVARSETLYGWLHSDLTQTMAIRAGLQGTVADIRLFLELGTDIERADRVEIDDKMFTVEDTSGEDTIQAMLTVNLRRID